MVSTFEIVPVQSRMLWVVLLLVSALTIGLIVMLIATARGSRHSSFEVSPAGLRLRGDLYGRLIPAGAIQADSARIVDLTTAPDLAPQSRTAGTSIGGYQAGWFRLNNGEKALLYLTDRRRAVYVPTTGGFSLLLSPQRPEAFIESLQAPASRQ